MLEPMSSQPLRVRVQDGQLVLDEPAELVEGEVFVLVPADEVDDDMDEEERARLHRALDRSFADSRAGRVIDGDVVLEKLRARRSGS